MLQNGNNHSIGDPHSQSMASSGGKSVYAGDDTTAIEDHALGSGVEFVSSDEERTRAPSNSSISRKRKNNAGPGQKTSCELCKARKVKCDRAQPACSWCARHGRECVYKERRNNQHRTDQIMELEAKVKRLDALLHALGRRVEEHVMNDHATGAVGFAPTSQGSRHESMDPYREGSIGLIPTRKATATLSETLWEQGFTARQTLRTADHEVPEHDRTSVQSLLNCGASENTAQSVAPSASTLVPERAEANSLGEDLPPNDVLYTLVDLFFKHTNTWIPILDRKTTFATFFGSTSLADGDRIVLYAIVACTLRFSKDPRLTPELKAHYHETAKRKVELYAFENVTIDACRALVILLVDNLGTSNGPRGWNLLALIIQNAKQLGLFSETKVYLAPGPGCLPETGSLRMVALAQPNSFIEDEGRRRLAWVIYQLDRYATIATTTLDFMLDDEDMQRQLPCSYDLFSKNVPVETCPCPSWRARLGFSGGSVQPLLRDRHDNLGSFSYHCQILRILSGIHEFLKTPLQTTSTSAVTEWRRTHRMLDGALNTWLQNLPGEYSRISALCHSDPASRVANWFMLHSVFVTSVIRLHSAAAYPVLAMLRAAPNEASPQDVVPREQGVSSPQTPQSIFTPSYHAVQRCKTAVDNLCDIIRDVREVNGLDLLGPPFAFSLWMAARVLIVHSAATGTPIDSKIDFFIETLAHVGRFWGVAANYAKILARVVRKGREGIVSFAEMRRSAYALVALTSTVRRSGLEPTVRRVTSQEDIDYIDVFNYFNVPEMSEAQPRQMGRCGVAALSVEAVGGTGQVMRQPSQNPEAEWLGY